LFNSHAIEAKNAQTYVLGCANTFNKIHPNMVSLSL